MCVLICIVGDDAHIVPLYIHGLMWASAPTAEYLFTSQINYNLTSTQTITYKYYNLFIYLLFLLSFIIKGDKIVY